MIPRQTGQLQICVARLAGQRALNLVSNGVQARLYLLICSTIGQHLRVSVRIKVQPENANLQHQRQALALGAHQGARRRSKSIKQYEGQANQEASGDDQTHLFTQHSGRDISSFVAQRQPCRWWPHGQT